MLLQIILVKIKINFRRNERVSEINHKFNVIIVIHMNIKNGKAEE